MKRLIISLLLLSMVGIANASNHASTCGELFDYWKSYKRASEGAESIADLWQGSEYRGYVTGWVDGNNRIRELGVNFPAGFSAPQAYQIVGNWLEKNPAMWALA